MLLISFSQILLLIFGCLGILISLFSVKGTLSPKFTILLLALLMLAFLFTSSLSNSSIETFENNEPIKFVDDTLPLENVPKQNKELKLKTKEKKVSDISQKEISKEKIINPTSKNSKTNNPPINKNLIPQEYDVMDKNLWTYKTSGSWRWDKTFEEYFETKTGWRKVKKGNAEISVEYIGSFSQVNGEDERLHIFSGGEIEIKVNGKTCCCESFISIPKGISHSQLKKAKEKLQKTISNLIMENKQKIVIQLQNCL